ncbi:hypothetical protein OAS47_03925 [Pelagibacteraceae bacterium]|nr:hypothetical protein [Pelagibacteraceae bacterium]
MGGPSNSGGGRTDAGPNRTTAYKAGVGNINEKGKRTSPDAFRNRGAENIKNSKFKTPATMILSKPLQAGSVKTRDFFTDKVLGSKNFKGTTKQDFEKMTAKAQENMYSDYIGNRNSGATDAYGNDISRDGRTGQTKKSIEQPKVASQMDNSEVKSDLITADKTAPTSVEMTQDEINVANKRGKKTKTILTSVVGDKSNATLSKKVLLG